MDASEREECREQTLRYRLDINNEIVWDSTQCEQCPDIMKCLKDIRNDLVEDMPDAIADITLVDWYEHNHEDGD